MTDTTGPWSPRPGRHWHKQPATVGAGKGFGCPFSHAGSPPGNSRVSQTNVQVAGVDEPDIIKNDGKYIYTISGSTLAIIDAYPPAGASVISKTEISDTPRDIFVSGDRLVLFTTGTGDAETSVQPATGS